MCDDREINKINLGNDVQCDRGFSSLNRFFIITKEINENILNGWKKYGVLWK